MRGLYNLQELYAGQDARGFVIATHVNKLSQNKQLHLFLLTHIVLDIAQMVISKKTVELGATKSENIETDHEIQEKNADYLMRLEHEEEARKNAERIVEAHEVASSWNYFWVKFIISLTFGLDAYTVNLVSPGTFATSKSFLGLYALAD